MRKQLCVLEHEPDVAPMRRHENPPPGVEEDLLAQAELPLLGFQQASDQRQHGRQNNDKTQKKTAKPPRPRRRFSGGLGLVRQLAFFNTSEAFVPPKPKELESA